MSSTARGNPEVGVRVVELEISIKAPVERVWKALVAETGVWWRRDFCTDAAAKDFVIEPVLGGKMYEDWGKGEGLVWATVTGVKAPTMLELAGVSSPAWGGPNTHYHSFRLEQRGDATVVRFSDAMHGRTDDGLATSLREGWLLLLNEALRGHCES
jgi:uncharacterized protein YndB with AHSA1/START domain